MNGFLDLTKGLIESFKVIKEALVRRVLSLNKIDRRNLLFFKNERFFHLKPLSKRFIRVLVRLNFMLYVREVIEVFVLRNKGLSL